MEPRTNFRLAAYLFLRKDNQVLLAKRENTSFEDGNFSTIGGHINENETILEATIREAKEEAGVTVKSQDLTLFHVMSRKSNYPYCDFFYSTKNWQGEPIINEPDLCSEIGWFKLDNLPQNTIPYIKYVLENINKNSITYSSYGW